MPEAINDREKARAGAIELSEALSREHPKSFLHVGDKKYTGAELSCGDQEWNSSWRKNYRQVFDRPTKKRTVGIRSSAF